MHSTKGFLWLSNYALHKTTLYNKFVELACDIILNDEVFDKNGTPSGGDGVVYSWKQIEPADDLTFYGNNFSIIGMYLNAPEKNYCGLFGYDADLKIIEKTNFTNCYVLGKHFVSAIGGYRVNSVKEIVVKDSYFSGQDCVAGIVSYVKEIFDCVNYSHIKELTTRNYCGGIVGQLLSDALVKGCVNYGNVDGYYGSGGIVGYFNTSATIENCENYGTITTPSGGAMTGGIVGFIFDSSEKKDYKLFSCKNYGEILGTHSHRGGIVGYARGNFEIVNCANFGYVEEGSYVGEILGSIYKSGKHIESKCLISNCEVYSQSGLAFVGLVNKSDATLTDEKVAIIFSNCKATYIRENMKRTLLAVLVRLSNFSNVEVSAKNIYIEYEDKTPANLRLFERISNIKKITLSNIYAKAKCNQDAAIKFISFVDNASTIKNCEGVVVQINIPSGNNNFYYGTDFSGYYTDWKTGKIGLKSMSGKGFFQGEVNEEYLKQKGFAKKVD